MSRSMSAQRGTTPTTTLDVRDLVCVRVPIHSLILYRSLYSLIYSLITLLYIVLLHIFDKLTCITTSL